MSKWARTARGWPQPVRRSQSVGGMKPTAPPAGRIAKLAGSSGLAGSGGLAGRGGGLAG